MNRDIIIDIKKIIQFSKLNIDLNLSDDLLIETFHNDIHWDGIAINYTLSEEFILKHWNKLHHHLIIINQKSLTPAFLCWLYRTYQEKEYFEFKNQNDDFLEHAKKIEEEVKIVMIEFNDRIRVKYL